MEQTRLGHLCVVRCKTRQRGVVRMRDSVMEDNSHCTSGPVRVGRRRCARERRRWDRPVRAGSLEVL